MLLWKTMDIKIQQTCINGKILRPYLKEVNSLVDYEAVFINVFRQTNHATDHCIINIKIRLFNSPRLSQTTDYFHSLSSSVFARCETSVSNSARHVSSPTTLSSYFTCTGRLGNLYIFLYVSQSLWGFLAVSRNPACWIISLLKAKCCGFIFIIWADTDICCNVEGQCIFICFLFSSFVLVYHSSIYI